ncbi:hypothetical protein ACRCUN_23980 [Mycobacterium sp. LTG2003]
MTVALALLILISPFVVAAALSWAAHRDGILRFRMDLFAPDYDSYRAEHELDAIRTRFEHDPVWPSAGVLGERR